MSRSLTSTLRKGRAAFEKRMRATCAVVRPTGSTVDVAGREVVTFTTVYEGRCYVRYPGVAFETNRDSQTVTIVQSRVVVRVPFGPAFAPGDVVEIVTDPDTPHLVGTQLRVASIDDQSQATAQRLLCEDNQAGVLPLGELGGSDGSSSNDSGS